MPTDACLVTVVIPIFNSASTLWRAAASALRQAAVPLEVLIVDDGSRDSSPAEAFRIGALDDRVRVIALPENRGKPHAMNLAIAEARGTWIAVLDADDWYAPDRVAVLLTAAERNGVELVADNQYFHDAGAGQVVRTAFPASRQGGPMTRRDFIAGSDPFAEFNFGMLKPMIHAGFVRRTGLRYREKARLGEDFLYLVEFFAAGGSAFLVSRPLYYWTQAFGGRSRRWTTTGDGPWRYDFQSARTANAEVREALRTSTNDDLITLLDRRDRALGQLHALHELRRSRDAGCGPARLIGSLSRHPSLWPIVLRRALHAASRRIMAHRAPSEAPHVRVDDAVT